MRKKSVMIYSKYLEKASWIAIKQVIRFNNAFTQTAIKRLEVIEFVLFTQHAVSHLHKIETTVTKKMTCILIKTYNFSSYCCCHIYTTHPAVPLSHKVMHSNCKVMFVSGNAEALQPCK